VVDPHGTHLSDALPKLQGLAEYAAEHGGVYRRIDSIANMGGDKFRVLDMTEASVRVAVMEATSAEALFKSGVAADYVW
jgi:type III restriction enzyme